MAVCSPGAVPASFIFLRPKFKPCIQFRRFFTLLNFQENHLGSEQKSGHTYVQASIVRLPCFLPVSIYPFPFASGVLEAKRP